KQIIELPNIGEKPRRRIPWFWVAIITSLLSLGGIGFGVFTVFNQPEKVVKVERITPKEPVPIVLKQDSKEIKQNQKEKTQIIKESQDRVYTIITDTSFGSGFLFEQKGTVVTNAHVVAGYTEVVLRNKNGQETTGQVIGISDIYDVALIQVDAYAGTKPLETELNETVIGSEIIALGSPQGFENSASIGYLTGLDRSFESEFQYENVYQIDAQISPGSSGGPLLDAISGKVIGINSALLTADSSIGFSIPFYTMEHLLRSWSDSPMSPTEVVDVFSFYDDYIFESPESEESVPYDEESKESEDSLEPEEPIEEEPESVEEDSYYFEDAGLSEFIFLFRDNYESALLYEDFYFIEDMLLYGSVAYWEMSDYIDEISGLGMVFNFLSNEVTNIVVETDFAVVSTTEVFDFMDATGEWTTYERSKEYVIVIEDGWYQITDIIIH
ncbi:MAG TPA: trypsin-like peptidase domain-containing protein, partial [Paenisporosarcina sp.]|nr:trypsin-like peptidase domain-containing protein [Paenisporosarcina sp.]